MEFDWDNEKAEINLAKHGVSFQEAASVFSDWPSVTFADREHSVDEERLIIVGHSIRGRLLFVCHTDQPDGLRIISAREATRRERKVYENAE